MFITTRAKALDRILIVNVNWLGDVLFSTPAIRALRKRFPESYIACLLPSRLKSVFENNPYVDEVLTYDPGTFFFSLLKYAGLILKIRKDRFETAIFFHASRTKIFLTMLGGVKQRIGFGVPSKRNLLTAVYPHPGGHVHRTDVFLNLVGHLGIPQDGRTPDFFPKKGAEAELGHLLQSLSIQKREPYAVVHAGGNWPLKRWPARYFAEWIRLFRKKFGWKVFLCGTAGEENISQAIRKGMNDPGVISLCGKTSVDTLAILLRGAKLLLSNDSGPIHLAASQKTKILGLFGPTSENITGPLSDGPVRILRKAVGCEVPCYFRSCDTRICLDWLTPGEVFEETRELLK